MVLVLVIFTIAILLAVDYALRRKAARVSGPVLHLVGAAGAPAAAAPSPLVDAFDVGRVPDGVFLAPGHTWASVEASGAVKLGLDRIPVTLLGGVDRVDLLPQGASVRRGDPVATLVRGDRRLQLRSPIDGSIAAVNPAISSVRLAADPYDSGWLYFIRPEGLGAALRRMFVAEEAAAWMKRELARVREFVTEFVIPQREVAVTMADGGVPIAGLAGRLDPEDWEKLVDGLFLVEREERS